MLFRMLVQNFFSNIKIFLIIKFHIIFLEIFQNFLLRIGKNTVDDQLLLQNNYYQSLKSLENKMLQMSCNKYFVLKL